jgi:hypothetical protein
MRPRARREGAPIGDVGQQQNSTRPSDQNDFVICFQYRSDAPRVQDALRLRLGKFGLTLECCRKRVHGAGAICAYEEEIPRSRLLAKERFSNRGNPEFDSIRSPYHQLKERLFRQYRPTTDSVRGRNALCRSKYTAASLSVWIPGPSLLGLPSGEDRPEQRVRVGARWQSGHQGLQAAVEQQHGKAVHQ